jgi:hypothetical protein
VNAKSLTTTVLTLTAAGLVAAGCASHKSSSQTASGAPSPEALAKLALKNEPSKVPFSEFKKVELKAMQLCPKYAANADAQKVARLMDGLLMRDYSTLFGQVKFVGNGGEFRPGSEPTLLISPRIEDARVVPEMERTWLTWGAGDSWLFVKVEFVDSRNGAVVAAPVFFGKAPLFWASFSSGELDKQVQFEVVKDIAEYTKANQ